MGIRDDIVEIRNRARDAAGAPASNAPDDDHAAIWDAILLLATRIEVGADFDPLTGSPGPVIVDADADAPVDGILPHDTPHAVIQRQPLRPPQH